MHEHISTTGSTKSFAGACSAQWLWVDIDREEDLDMALRDTRRLVSSLDMRYGCRDALLCFFSGAKGFHVGLPCSIFTSYELDIQFNDHARGMAERLAGLAGVAIDTNIYDRVRAFRAPNSRHPKTGLHKRFLTIDELLHLKIDRILDLAKTPEPFDVPVAPSLVFTATDDWAACKSEVASRSEAMAVAQRRIGEGPGANALNRDTLAFIREGAVKGSRHQRLFSAAANLAEHGCSLELAAALLSESALDTGLSPSDVERQIKCGFHHMKGKK